MSAISSTERAPTHSSIPYKPLCGVVCTVGVIASALVITGALALSGHLPSTPAGVAVVATGTLGVGAATIVACELSKKKTNKTDRAPIYIIYAIFLAIIGVGVASLAGAIPLSHIAKFAIVLGSLELVPALSLLFAMGVFKIEEKIG